MKKPRLRALKKRALTQAELKKRLSYDPETGVFTRLMTKARFAAGEPIKTTSKGYLRVCIDRVIYECHRLAWLYVFGAYPTGPLDHINRVRSDNRISNLREVTWRENVANSGPRATNTSGIKCVSWNKFKNKWQVKVAGRYVGVFKDKDEAALAAHAAHISAYGDYSAGFGETWTAPHYKR